MVWTACTAADRADRKRWALEDQAIPDDKEDDLFIWGFLNTSN